MGDNEGIKTSQTERSSADFRATTRKGGKTAVDDGFYTADFVNNNNSTTGTNYEESTSVTYRTTAEHFEAPATTSSGRRWQRSSFNNVNTSDEAYFSVVTSEVEQLQATEGGSSYATVSAIPLRNPTHENHSYGLASSIDKTKIVHGGGIAPDNFSIVINAVNNTVGGFGSLNTSQDSDFMYDLGGFLFVNATQATMNSTTMDNIPSNFSEENFVRNALGDRYKTELETWILTFVYCVIFITGVVGNICTCIVIYKNNYMHTATNYYLFSLAISDVLTLILGLPPELYAVWEAYPWRFGEPYCLFKTFLTEMTSSASILTITAFTVERYVAICHPYRAQRMSTLSRAVKIIVLIWLAACLSAVPYPIHTQVFYRLSHPYTGEPMLDSLICNIPMVWMTKMRAVFQFTTFLLFIFPMTVITVLYLLIGITLKKAGLARKTSAEGIHQGSQSSKIIQMLVAVVVAFFICWAPFHAQRLMTSYIIHESQWTPTLMDVQNIIWYISGVLYFVSSTTNPILYNLMSRKYREAFKDTLCRPCCKQGRNSPAQNGFTTTNRTRGYVTSDRSTIYSYYSNSSKKYVSMIPKDNNHELNHYTTQLSNSSNSDPNGGNNQKVTISVAEEYNGAKLDPISECSHSDTKDSFGSALNNQLNLKSNLQPAGGDEEAGNASDSADPETELLHKLEKDPVYGTASSVYTSEPHHAGGTSGQPLEECDTTCSGDSSASHGSLVSGGSLSSLPAVLARHLKEEMMDIDGKL